MSKATELPDAYKPGDAVELWGCTAMGCNSHATRAVYQHGHKKDAKPTEKNREAMFTWELPAYVDGHGALLKGNCPVHGCSGKVEAKLVKCGNCGGISTIHEGHVKPPQPGHPKK